MHDEAIKSLPALGWRYLASKKKTPILGGATATAPPSRADLMPGHRPHDRLARNGACWPAARVLLKNLSVTSHCGRYKARFATFRTFRKSWPDIHPRSGCDVLGDGTIFGLHP